MWTFHKVGVCIVNVRQHCNPCQHKLCWRAVLCCMWTCWQSIEFVPLRQVLSYTLTHFCCCPLMVGQAGDVFRQAIAVLVKRQAWSDAVTLLMRFGEACDKGGAHSSQAKAYLGAIVVCLHAGDAKQAWQVNLAGCISCCKHPNQQEGSRRIGACAVFLHPFGFLPSAKSGGLQGMLCGAAKPLLVQGAAAVCDKAVLCFHVAMAPAVVCAHRCSRMSWGWRASPRLTRRLQQMRSSLRTSLGMQPAYRRSCRCVYVCVGIAAMASMQPIHFLVKGNGWCADATDIVFVMTDQCVLPVMILQGKSCFKLMDTQVARLAVKLPQGDLSQQARAIAAVMGGRDPNKTAEQEAEDELL